MGIVGNHGVEGNRFEHCGGVVVGYEIYMKIVQENHGPTNFPEEKYEQKQNMKTSPYPIIVYICVDVT